MTRHWYASVATLALAVITVLLLPLTAAAAPSVSEFPVCTNGFTQVSPAVSGTRVVWVDYRSGGLYGVIPTPRSMRAPSAAPRTLVADTPNTYQVDVSGKLRVWFSGLSGSATGADIYGIDLTGGAAFPMSTATGDQYSVAISGNNVVWEDDRNDASVNADIYGCTLPGVVTFPCATWRSSSATRPSTGTSSSGRTTATATGTSTGSVSGRPGIRHLHEPGLPDLPGRQRQHRRVAGLRRRRGRRGHPGRHPARPPRSPSVRSPALQEGAGRLGQRHRLG